MQAMSENVAASGLYRVVPYVVNSRGEEVGSLAAGHLTERLRIVAVDEYGAGAILAEMVAGGLATAELLAAAPQMRDRIAWVAAKLDAWSEDQRRVYCSTIDTAMKAKAMNRCDGYTDLAQRLRAALPKERQ